MKKLILPYAFRGIAFDHLQLYYPGRLVDRPKAIQYLGEGTHTQFSRVYSDVLQAIAEDDREYLESIMEKRLYKRTIEGIEQIQKKNMKINYLEDSRANFEEIFDKDEDGEDLNIKNQQVSQFVQNQIINATQYKEIDMKIMLEAHGVFGARINREENVGKVMELRGRLSSRSYFVNFSNLMNLYHNQILSLNVYFQTTRRLYVTDEDGDLIHGEDTLNKEISHVWRFETYTPNFDWVLTDMDTFLEGNPYYRQPPNKGQNEEQTNSN
ncbi:hypothetical protein TTHERM_00723310 (macronuclear) [Tetrahymena thermophila SB210]|uniref:Uncharacterized protein n=1 Tax=Tetrahymena thermophila (strain SB210) TaxID=312017 RepID=I7LZL3_TETTS|nr:hypothetical protein TTHERM_00723310 [Tetrahymena thermophila SB210]EAR84146.1 hypothetical protein TTHERM_00723310 [Tetrahymena thermophila SB210]|eukprot:XP_001031809.1 hypothetical protein TTHERM_00723310 [Tetrahymena thermophila SB210]